MSEDARIRGNFKNSICHRQFNVTAYAYRLSDTFSLLENMRFHTTTSNISQEHKPIVKSSDIEHNCNTVHFDGWNESGDHDRFIPVFLHAFVYVHSCDMSIRRVRRQVHFRNLGGSKRLSNERPYIRHHQTKFSLGICCLRVLYNVARGNRSIIRPASGRLQNGERWKEVLPDWLPFFVVGRSCADSAFGCRGVGLLSPLRPVTSRYN